MEYKKTVIILYSEEHEPRIKLIYKLSVAYYKALAENNGKNSVVYVTIAAGSCYALNVNEAQSAIL